MRTEEHRFERHKGNRTVKHWELMVKSKRKWGIDDDQFSGWDYCIHSGVTIHQDREEKKRFEEWGDISLALTEFEVPAGDTLQAVGCMGLKMQAVLLNEWMPCINIVNFLGLF